MTTEQLQILKDNNITITEEQLETLKGLPLNNVDTDSVVRLAEICNILYRAGMPIVPDAYYDHVIIAELIKRDPDHPLLNQVEIEPPLGKTKRLPRVMLSTNKAYSGDEVKAWLTTIVKAANVLNYDPATIMIRITPKLDGYACYDDGFTLYTRGDGHEGTDVTYIIDRGVEVIGGRLVGPGEIVVNKPYFEEHLAGEYENTRNFIGSVIREQQLSLPVQKACLDKAIVFHPFSLLPGWQGTIPELLENLESIVDYVWGMVDFDVDGVVFEVTDFSIQQEMGFTKHHHRWQLAFKRNEEAIEVPVLQVIHQTGKTGVITPVAELEPTVISGVTVSKATAHNFGHVMKWSLGIGSIVKVVRAGLVIPKIVGVVKAGVVNIPTECPSCGSPVGWENDKIYCSNLVSCPAQVERRLLYFFDTLGNCDGFGSSTIENIVKQRVNSISQVYDLTTKHLRDMNFGPKESVNLYNALVNSRRILIKDWQFLAAFGIPNIGKGGCELLLQHYPLLEVFNLTKEQITAIKGFADKSAETIINALKEIKPEFDKLYSKGFNLKITPIGEVRTTLSRLSNKTIVFTGTMDTKTRETMESEAKELGAKVTSTVTKSTDYLVSGLNPGVSKLKAAQKFGITILNEYDYEKLFKS